MPDEGQNTIVTSIQEARRLAEATGRAVEYKIVSNTQTFQPKLGFDGSLNLRFWLLRKRVVWTIQKTFRRLKR